MFQDSKEGSTHWVCQERLEEFGGVAVCCGCSGHVCRDGTEIKRIYK